MLFRWIFIFLSIPYLHGCVTTFPQESDITGTWEGISLPYVLFEYESSDKAHIIAYAYDEEEYDEEFIIGKLSNFVSNESGFTLAVTGNKDGETITGVLRGKLYGSRILLHVLLDDDSEEEQVWLMKSSDLDYSRVAAKKALNTYLEAGE